MKEAQAAMRQQVNTNIAYTVAPDQNEGNVVAKAYVAESAGRAVRGWRARTTLHSYR